MTSSGGTSPFNFVSSSPQGRALRGNLARLLLKALLMGAALMPPANYARCRKGCWKDGGTGATMCLGASNNKKRTRIGADHVFVQCDLKIRLIHWIVVSRVFVCCCVSVSHLSLAYVGTFPNDCTNEGFWFQILYCCALGLLRRVGRFCV